MQIQGSFNLLSPSFSLSFPLNKSFIHFFFFFKISFFFWHKRKTNTRAYDFWRIIVLTISRWGWIDRGCVQKSGTLGTMHIYNTNKCMSEGGWWIKWHSYAKGTRCECGVWVGTVSPWAIQQAEPISVSMYDLCLSAVCPDTLVGVSMVCVAVTTGGAVEYLHTGDFWTGWEETRGSFQLTVYMI